MPGAADRPVNDPLPGFAALMAFPVRLLAPHWTWLRGAELLAAAALVFCVWRLARRLSGEAAGFAAAFLVAANPTLVGWAGVALPDAPFAACAAAGILLLALPRFSPAALAAVAGLAALLRPEGVVLAPALAVPLALLSKAPLEKTGVTLAVDLKLIAALFCVTLAVALAALVVVACGHQRLPCASNAFGFGIDRFL